MSEFNLNVILFGPPGSGKGTYSNMLVSHYSFSLVRMSSILSSSSDPQILQKIASGDLISDDLTITCLKDFVGNQRSGFVFDGFPRTVAQSIFLKEFLSVDFFLKLCVSDDEVLRRISMRKVCPSCSAVFSSTVSCCDVCDNVPLVSRVDDNCDVSKYRLDKYKKSESRIVDFFAEKLINIDAANSIDSVYNSILSKMKLFS